VRKQTNKQTSVVVVVGFVAVWGEVPLPPLLNVRGGTCQLHRLIRLFLHDWWRAAAPLVVVKEKVRTYSKIKTSSQHDKRSCTRVCCCCSCFAEQEEKRAAAAAAMLGGRTHHEVIEISSDDDDYDDDDNAEEVLHHQQQVGAGSCKTEPSSMATSFLQVHGEEDEEDEDAARHKLQQPSPDAERRSSPYYLANFMLMVESVRRCSPPLAPLLPLVGALRSRGGGIPTDLPCRLHGHLLTPEEEHLLHVFAGAAEAPRLLTPQCWAKGG
jgi:hypothetical protein